MKKYIFDIDIKERVNISIEADNNNEQIHKFRIEGSIKDYEIDQTHYSHRKLEV